MAKTKVVLNKIMSNLVFSTSSSHHTGSLDKNPIGLFPLSHRLLDYAKTSSVDMDNKSL